MKRFLLALALSLVSSGALAQGCGPQNPNCIVPTAPFGDNSNIAASTAFVQAAVSAVTITGQALTKTDDANVTMTLGGSPTTALVNAASITMGWSGTLARTRGGCNGTWTASVGGIFWSDASQCQVLAGTATANLPLLSGSSATPAWAAITYPTTATSGGVAYFSSATAMGSSGVLSANNPVIGGGAGVAPSSGTRSGNTTQFVTTTGAQTNGNCVNIDASGNHVASGSACGGGATIDVQVFTTTGANTWTRPAGVTVVRVFICGAGGGGGGGGRAAAATAVEGGGGGGGGYCQDVTYKAADAGASQTVTIATGGTAGAGATVNGNAGTNGGVGGTSTFGSLLSAFGGGGGQGGPGAAGNAGGGGGGGPSIAGGVGGGAGTSGQGGQSQFGISPVPANPNLATVACAGMPGTTAGIATIQVVGCPYAGAGGGSAYQAAVFVGTAGGDATSHGGGGGGGGSVSTDNTGRAGSNGGRSIGCPTAPAGGAAGNNAGGSTAADFNYHPGCGGGGGGSSTVTAGGAGGNGTSAAGGGGGGAGDAVNGGAGGTGGNGFALVISQ